MRHYIAKILQVVALLLGAAVQGQVMDSTLLNEVEVKGYRPMERTSQIDGKHIVFTTGAEGGVESVVKTLIGVTSRNSMSTQYNVRGGNFDENLVYINGFEVFRPFLARSGQQEGMSVIHPHLVDQINFSAGGFGPELGDKLSSVLEVGYASEGQSIKGTVESSLTGVSLAYQNPHFFKDWHLYAGARYRNNALLLNATDLESDYRPINGDVQVYLRGKTGAQSGLAAFAHMAHNRMNQVPQNRQTSFGSLQEALQLNVYFDGREKFGYDTQYLGVQWWTTANELIQNQQISLNIFHSNEKEITDVIGYYRLSELNNDLGSDDFGDIALVRGVGAYQDYRRNFLDAVVAQAKYKGIHYFNGGGSLSFGTELQYENFYDRYKEWQRIDSAGYSVPHQTSAVDSVVNGVLFSTAAEGLELYTHVQSTQTLENFRAKSWFKFQNKYPLENGMLEYALGMRLQWAQLNGEFRASPRGHISYKPFDGSRSYSLSAGSYDQYPFYRELRQKDGRLNPKVLSQQALHLILRTDKSFELWERPFVWSVEGYYKGLRRVNLYDVENVRIRYAAENNAEGRVFGIDSRVNGEFVKGTDSWFSFSLFKVQERPVNHEFWYARPTDTRYNLGIYFQDYLPGDPNVRMSLTLMVSGGFPFGPNGPGESISLPEERVFRSPPYRRADLGLIKVLQGKWTEKFEEIWVSAEIFNLLQARNTVSYLWIRDASTAGQYAVPNYMTTRLINLKLHVEL